MTALDASINGAQLLISKVQAGVMVLQTRKGSADMEEYKEALVVGISSLVSSVVTYLLTRRKQTAEIEKLKAEAESIQRKVEQNTIEGAESALHLLKEALETVRVEATHEREEHEKKVDSFLRKIDSLERQVAELKESRCDLAPDCQYRQKDKK